jgi:hypothetical protein
VAAAKRGTKTSNPNLIFVFGSNESGIHGAGAAAYAKVHHGAVYGVGWGLQGTSFGIPTKDWDIETLDLGVIDFYVARFLAFAELKKHLTFKVTRIGCGLAGLEDYQIAPMFTHAPINCQFDEVWKEFLPSDLKYWGTF